MNHSRFLPPPVRLSQAFEGETGGDGISRRTFIKRTGGATVATMVAWNTATTDCRAQQYSWGPSSLEPFLKCTHAPPYVNVMQEETEFGDKKHCPVSTWLAYANNTHSLKVKVMPVGVAVGWIGKSAICAIGASADTAGEHSMGGTQQANAHNTVFLDESSGYPEITWIPADDDDVKVQPPSSPYPQYYWNGNWHDRYVNCYVRIAGGRVLSVWSEWPQWIEPNSSDPAPWYLWERITNNFPIDQMYWEFEIIWQ